MVTDFAMFLHFKIGFQILNHKRESVRVEMCARAGCYVYIMLGGKPMVGGTSV